jgi:hypothetical protein
MKRLLGVIAIVMLVASGCSEEASVLKSGTARVPDDFGVATDVTLERIQLDDKRTFEIADDVESFATRSHHIEPLLGWEGKYVHIGLNEDKQATWIAGIGLVNGTPPKVTYSGLIKEVQSGTRRVTFDDGTVLEFESGVKIPGEGREVVLEIDARPDRGAVVSVLSGAGER